MTQLNRPGVLAVSIALFVVGSPGLSVASEPAGTSSYLELRIYKTHEGQRDRFMSYFEEHYLESQEAVGMRIWGQFLDSRTANQFVWLRGYRTMEERQAGLLEFYTGALWKETGPLVREMLAERATHVHFLEAVSSDDGFDESFDRSLGEHEAGVVVAQVFMVSGDVASLVRRLNETLVPSFVERGAVPLGLFRSSDEPNNFPALPFIEDERVVVWFASFESAAAFESAQEAAPVEPSPFETFVLEPGKRSRLFHRGR